jgi:hypothetical protein
MEMPKWFLIAVLLLIPGAGAAQEVADGSDTNVASEVVAVMYARSLEQFKDPYSLKFYKLHMDKDNEKYVCGAYNAKNEMGGYTGLRPFRFGIENGMFIELTTPC